MSNQLKELLVQRIQSGLSRRSIVDPARWACKYRYMGHPYPGLWTFEHHPWLRAMHTADEKELVGQKAAQCGYTEWALNMTFFFLDVKKMDVLYVLPNSRPDATDFSSSRFDKAVELSDHLKNLFSTVSNVGQKRSGDTTCHIRGSQSRSGMMSLPVSLLVLDELNEMDQDNIALAEQRLRGQIERHCLKLSTPTIPEFGISEFYEPSTQEHWCFPCPSCSKYIDLKFPDNIVITADSIIDERINDTHLICNHCRAKLPHEDKIRYLNKGMQVPLYPGREVRGFTVSQLYAMHLHPSVIAKDYLKAQTDPASDQVFHNASLGVPYIVSNAKITDEMINACVRPYKKVHMNRLGPTTMGVDQGKKINIEIDLWELNGRSGNDINSYAFPKVLTHLEVDHFEQLDLYMHAYNITFCVIDASPENRKALEFANRFPGRVKLCRYIDTVGGRNLTKSDNEDHHIHANRTNWLDLSLGRFRTGTIMLPGDTTHDYKSHIKAQVRVPGKDRNGNPTARYHTPGKMADHYGHARCYAEMALPFALGLGVGEDILS